MLKILALVLFSMPMFARAEAISEAKCQTKIKKLVIATYNGMSQLSKIGPGPANLQDFNRATTDQTDTDGKPLVEYKGEWFMADGSSGDFIPGSAARALVREDRCEIVSLEVRIRGND